MPLPAPYQLHTIVSHPFEENSYVLWRLGSAQALIVDPGLEPDRIVSFLQRHRLHAQLILNTHGHGDHIAGNEALKLRDPQALLIIGAREASMLTDPHRNLSAMFGMPVTSPPADHLVGEGDTVEFDGLVFEVLEIPGHTPGHVVYLCRQAGLAFVGDVLFAGSIGRYDFPGGDGEALVRGIRTKLLCLPDETLVYPGHGPPTTIGEERATNPFLIAS
ncbi:MAG: MBL fold metallo-hydrolase [Gemmataceae bacterium]